MSVHIDHEKCIACGACIENCAYDAMIMVDDVVSNNPDLCESCGICTIVCPKEAVSIEE
jgi:MinD superfamily P-loop ATPase